MYFTLTHFLAKTTLSSGYGGVQNSSGDSGGLGGGGLFMWSKIEIPGRRRGLREIPSVVGV